MRSLGRLIGHARFLPFGVRDRLLRLLFPTQRMPDQRFVVPLGEGVYGGRFDSYIDWSIYFYGQYERHVLRFLTRVFARLDRPVVFWDVGANAGQHSVFAASLGAQVHAFEPYGAVLEQLRKNASRNPSLAIAIHPHGLGASNEDRRFTPPSNENRGTGHFDAEGSLVLPIRRGDDIDAPPPSIMKIDVEGYEAEVLRGLAATLVRARPIILCEFSERTRKEIGDLRQALPASYLTFDLTGPERPRLRPAAMAGRGEMVVLVPEEKTSLVSG